MFFSTCKNSLSGWDKSNGALLNSSEAVEEASLESSNDVWNSV